METRGALADFDPSSGVLTLDDLRGREIVIGGTGPAAGSTVEARALQSIFGFNFRIVHGYPAQADVRFAAARPMFCALSNRKLAATGFLMPTWQDALHRWLASRSHHATTLDAPDLTMGQVAEARK